MRIIKGKGLCFCLTVLLVCTLTSCSRNTVSTVQNVTAETGSADVSLGLDTSEDDDTLNSSADKSENGEEAVSLIGVEIEDIDEAIDEENGKTVMKANRDVNIRTSPSSDSTVVGTLTKGTTVTAISGDEYWTCIEWQNGEYYVYTPYLDVVDTTGGLDDEDNEVENMPNTTVSTTILHEKVGAALDTPITMYIKSGVNIHTGPYPDAKIITSLTAGTEVTVLALGDSWSAIDLDGTVGYLNTSYLTS